MPTPTFHEQFSEATKANLDAHLAILSTFASKAIESVEKVVELNLAIAKNSFAETHTTAKKLISAKDAQEFFNVTAAQTQPTSEKATEYARHLVSIITNAQAELGKATEEHVADTNRKIISIVEELSKNAPAGSEQAIALIKSAIGSATAGYEQLNKSAKQAVDQISQVTAKVTRAKK